LDRVGGMGMSASHFYARPASNRRSGSNPGVLGSSDPETTREDNIQIQRDRSIRAVVKQNCILRGWVIPDL
jgi:hypothetical protein